MMALASQHMFLSSGFASGAVAAITFWQSTNWQPNSANIIMIIMPVLNPYETIVELLQYTVLLTALWLAVSMDTCI